jgi:hypothetical protein
MVEGIKLNLRCYTHMENVHGDALKKNKKVILTSTDGACLWKIGNVAVYREHIKKKWTRKMWMVC